MQRQLAKMLVRAEQARSMAFQTAEALRRSDEGDAEARRLLRILTPLLKFRACRDARTVTGDAMEVRGGCGYIEEWPDPRLLRDAHLGSIWEGTSNVVALDVLRAARKEGGLKALSAHVRGLLAEAPLDGCLEAFERASSLLQQRAGRRGAGALGGERAVSRRVCRDDGLGGQAHGRSAYVPCWRAWCCSTACCRATRWRRCSGDQAALLALLEAA